MTQAQKQIVFSYLSSLTGQIIPELEKTTLTLIQIQTIVVCSISDYERQTLRTALEHRILYLKSLGYYVPSPQIDLALSLCIEWNFTTSEKLTVRKGELLDFQKLLK